MQLNVPRVKKPKMGFSDNLLRTKKEAFNIQRDALVMAVCSLSENQCKYLLGDNSFCPHDKIEGKSYCAEHAAICYDKMRSKPSARAYEAVVRSGIK